MTLELEAIADTDSQATHTHTYTERERQRQRWRQRGGVTHKHIVIIDNLEKCVLMMIQYKNISVTY